MTTQDTAAAEIPATVVRFDPNAWKKALEIAAPPISAGGTGQALRRREADVVIEHQLCEPGYFTAPFKVGLRALSSDDELAALKQATNEMSVGHFMAKRSIVALNDQPLQGHERDLLWEILGSAGRTAVINAFSKHCTGMDGELLGKSLAAITVR
jgi:hypothetical protein